MAAGIASDVPIPDLALVPYGTGCDLARSLGVPRDLTAALTIARDGRRVQVDVGRVGYTTPDGQDRRYFINIASAGASGEVVRLTNQSGKRLGPTLTFLVATLETMARFEGGRVRIEVDDTILEDIHLNVAFVCNAQYCGSGMRVGRGARMDDGLLEVIVATHDGFLRSLPKFGPLYSGRLQGVAGVTRLQGKRVVITPLTDAEIPVEADGEQPGLLPGTWDLLPGALTVRMAASAPVLMP